MSGLKHVLDPSIPVFLLGCLGLLIFLRKFLRRDHFYILVISSLLGLLLLEGVCRLIGLGGYTRTAKWEEDRVVGKDFPYAYQPNGRLLYHYPDNPRGYFNKKNEVLGAINSKGFRGSDKDFEKKAGNIRLAFLGDSFTLGIGVKDEDTLPYDVEKKLKQKYENVEVLNFGVSSTDTPYQIQLLERYVLKFKPDIVVVVLFLNDVKRKGTIGFLSRPVVLKQIRKYSYFANALIGSIEKTILSKRMIRYYHEGFRDTNPGYQSVQSALIKGKSLSSQYRFHLIVAVYPVLFRLKEGYPFRSIHQKIEKFCRTQDILSIDLLSAFSGKNDREMWVHPTDQHPNEVAHELAAGQVAAYIRKEGLIERIMKNH